MGGPPAIVETPDLDEKEKGLRESCLKASKALMDGTNPAKVLICRRDYEFILKLTQESPNIETGGDLWGKWEDDGRCIVEAVTGPGEGARKFVAAFYQDSDFMLEAGNFLLEKNIFHIGTWHSHHQIAAPQPSGGDIRTYTMAMKEHHRSVFVAFIAGLEREGRYMTTSALKPVVYPYIFYKHNHRAKYCQCSFQIIDDEEEDAQDSSPSFQDYTPILNEMAQNAIIRARQARGILNPNQPIAWINQGQIKSSQVLPNIIQIINNSPSFFDAKPGFENDLFVITFSANKNTTPMECRLIISSNFIQSRQVLAECISFPGQYTIHLRGQTAATPEEGEEEDNEVVAAAAQEEQEKGISFPDIPSYILHGVESC